MKDPTPHSSLHDPSQAVVKLQTPHLKARCVIEAPHITPSTAPNTPHLLLITFHNFPSPSFPPLIQYYSQDHLPLSLSVSFSLLPSTFFSSSHSGSLLPYFPLHLLLSAFFFMFLFYFLYFCSPFFLSSLIFV